MIGNFACVIDPAEISYFAVQYAVVACNRDHLPLFRYGVRTATTSSVSVEVLNLSQCCGNVMP